jgi:S-adenosylmethionine:tRNA ribosyltransferase-isomerase
VTSSSLPDSSASSTIAALSVAVACVAPPATTPSYSGPRTDSPDGFAGRPDAAETSTPYGAVKEQTMTRIALVTGARRGLGAVVATFLGTLGYEVVLTARRAEDLKEVAARLPAGRGRTPSPGASHIAMLYAVAGRELVRSAYAELVRERYRWHEFGDSHLLLPR